MQMQNSDDNTPEALEANRVQFLAVGGTERLVQEIVEAAGPSDLTVLHVTSSDRKAIEWQEKRLPGRVLALVVLDSEADSGIADAIETIQLVKVSFRPARLVALVPSFAIEPMLRMMRAGADGFLPLDAGGERIRQELEGPGAPRDYFFPDNNRWIDSLRRTVEELDPSIARSLQLKKLLRIFVNEMGVERASIVLREEGGVRVAAAIGFPEDIDMETVAKVREGSITEWVLTNKRPRLILGKHAGSKPLDSSVKTAVCAPIMMQRQVFGAVNFSSSRGRDLTPNDLSTTEVFACLLGFALSNKQLLEENLAKERLATIGGTISTLSHCIKNLLTVFKGSTMIMQTAIEDQDFGKAAMGMRILNNGVRRIENLTLDLLDITKTREPAPEKVPIEEFLSDLYDGQEAMMVQKKHTFELLSSVEGEYMLDRYRLHRALMNLLTNATDAIQVDGKIELDVSEENGMLAFAVADNGQGVPEEKLTQIFHSFYSSKGSTGTGLGLAMVSKFCEENHGTVTADHHPQLGGLRVTIRIPLNRA